MPIFRLPATLPAAFALALAALAVAVPARAQERVDAYAVSGIAPALLASSPDAVVRLSEHAFHVRDAGRATETVRLVVTVFREAGRDAAITGLYYDRFRKVERFDGKLFDGTGRLLRRAGKNDALDMGATSGYSLYEDHRIRTLSLFDNRFPYTVELAYELRHEGVFGWPSWYAQAGGYPTEASRFQVSVPAGTPVRYRLQGAAPEPTVTADGGRQVYRWGASMLTAFKPEPYGPAASRQVAAVFTAPAAFEIEGKPGDMTTWEGLGRWLGALWDGRAALPEAARADVARIVEGAPDDREKARRLYAYVQGRTRYVSVQLGIGGWQPFDANYVHTRGYGDCKALTNYLGALLAEAGVAAYPAIIGAGRGAPDVVAGFPSNQFNHAILFVPLPGDSLWLETTSQTAPFAHLGDFTEDRHALVLFPDGARLVRTPATRPEWNAQFRRTDVTLAADGSATATLRTRYTGNQGGRVRSALTDASGIERTAWLHDEIGLPNFELLAADFATLDTRADTLALGARVRVPRYAALAGSRLFVPLVLERWTAIPEAVTARTQPVEFFPYPFEDVDTLAFALPAGYRVEAVPAAVEVEAPFARYEVRASVDGRTLRVVRRFVARGTTMAPEQYADVRRFAQRVAEADRAQAVLVRE